MVRQVRRSPREYLVESGDLERKFEGLESE